MQQNPHWAGFVLLRIWWSRGNLKQFGIYLFFLVNNLLVNLLGIPVGTLHGLDSDGRCFLELRPKNESGSNLSSKWSRC
jgi:hypothetical protein